ELNAAIDREAFIADALNGHGSPARGAAWPRNWAYDASLPGLQYQPGPRPDELPRRSLNILVGDPAYERLALVLQRQLQAVGIDPHLELVPKVVARLQAGDFDAVLADYMQGPNMVRPS